MDDFFGHASTWIQGANASWRNYWNQGLNRRTFSVMAAVLVPIVALFFMYVRTPDNFPLGEIISIPADTPLKDVAHVLEEAGVVRAGLTLELLIRMRGQDRSVHAGDYQFKQRKNVFEVADALVRGDFGIDPLRVRIPAGLTVAQISEMLEKRLVRFDAKEFLAIALPYEGHLYPDTYFFLPTATAKTVFEAMKGNFDTQTAEFENEILASGHTRDEIITMASIIEREESDYKDRRMISGILWRRISIGMPLQVDAAFVYILGKGSHQLTLKDLQDDSPYNTYRNKGLPPGPIANPSLSSIQAALDPIESDYIFYLADKEGTTYYSETYAEHLQKKRRYLGP
ncbi:MAG: endolytic transglycosylase MltG [Patescibacteria group bacterium]